MKCAGAHGTRYCIKTRGTPATCANCKGVHPANCSKCHALLAFLNKKYTITNKLQIHQNQPISTHTQQHHFSSLPSSNVFILLPNPTTNTKNQTRPNICQDISSANSPQSSQTNEQTSNNDLRESIEQLKSSDLDLFLRIINLIQKHYTKCINNLDRVKATILIVKELEYDP